MKLKNRKSSGRWRQLEFHDPERRDNTLDRKKRRLDFWKEHLKDPIVALDKASKWVGEFVLGSFLAPDLVVSSVAFAGLLQRL